MQALYQRADMGHFDASLWLTALLRHTPAAKRLEKVNPLRPKALEFIRCLSGVKLNTCQTGSRWVFKSPRAQLSPAGEPAKRISGRGSLAQRYTGVASQRPKLAKATTDSCSGAYGLSIRGKAA